MLDHFDDDELTTISFSNSPPLPPERRKNLRHVTVLRVAKLQTPRSEELCLVRNISAGGLMAHIYSELNIGEPVTAEFKSGQAVSGRVLWRRDGLAGIQFNEPVNAAKILADNHDYSPSAQQPRAPRVGIDVKARICASAHGITRSRSATSRSPAGGSPRRAAGGGAEGDPDGQRPAADRRIDPLVRQGACRDRVRQPDRVRGAGTLGTDDAGPGAGTAGRLEQ